MGWMQKLYETYEHNAQLAGRFIDGKTPLSPVSHIVANAQIEITISEDGTFFRAEKVLKEDRSTFIPVTESSAGRASGIAPHPLCDTLSYVAGDYENYLPEGSKEAQKSRDKHLAFLEQLRRWAESEMAHEKVKAVCQYCDRGTTIADLVEAGIVECGEDGTLSAKKIEGNAYEKCLVRWRILSVSNPDAPTATWEDPSLFENYIHFLDASNDSAKKDVCYVTGKESVIAVNHPKGIVAASYGAKLISANDAYGFTYRGRFSDGSEANAVSYEVTQKAHNALRWLVANQGVFYGGRTFVCWNPKGKSVPAFQLDPYGEDDEEDVREYTMPIYRKRLFKALEGYRSTLDANDDIVIMSLDAATTGRLSVTYYSELKASDFLDRIEKWQLSCCWYFTHFTQEKKPSLRVDTPRTNRAVEYAFGTEQGAFVKVDDRVLKEHTQRLLNCIINEQPVPRDLVYALMMRASTPLAYSVGNRERILSTACAFINKYHNTKGEENWMELKKEKDDRSYLFGRLLAVAEKVERSTYSREEARETNAIRLWSAFQQHPEHTWRILREALIPYFDRLPQGSRNYYNDLIGDILSTFREQDEPVMNMGLADNYLFGYYLQRKELNTYKVKENEIQEEK